MPEGGKIIEPGEEAVPLRTEPSPRITRVQETVKAYIALARPSHYIKNAFIWLPLFFGHRVTDYASFVQTLWGFIAFCLAASSIYIVNDLKDTAEDARHPVKRFRPLAGGKVGTFGAILFLLSLLAFSYGISFLSLPDFFVFFLSAYLVLNLAYSFYLKHVAILDITCIACGFVLRVVCGGVTADVRLSHWIVIMTFLLALFLALAKRRDDLLLLNNGVKTRKSIDGYNMEFVGAGMVIMASVIIVSYILYTVSGTSIELHGTDKLYLSAFWVIMGLLRYMQITFVEQRSGSPTLIILNDRFLHAVIILWILNCYFLIYGYKF